MTTTVHELAYRAHDGIYVTMFWDAASDQVTVAVADAKTDDAFEVVVLPGERALDVFHHPYAYRAVREQHGASTLVHTT
ncbi:hypothetical protein OJ997_13095 [Solirubrobacter phytolaccae]|uniref:Uncharacterized protein n=1 Tax=Solirubrobacter phytolaccae TaxID=1404360 RepID=A0A9X3NAK0_9ACTN|nr:hypothetical protein [Solirubrobacter phytolaccae]MDA0181237.1 hypothetical protein [Solirubrobacter phytolaccae]